ncbi:MAG TPA: peptidoglycan DD-metalloendopeptidase family protein [Candidatus Polarisedimenticolia bacterium]|nr:peptidoglycan DD-metalloendopeptidase family protein [Candidatus Polarisedimenticolia bacterium]
MRPWLRVLRHRRGPLLLVVCASLLPLAPAGAALLWPLEIPGVLLSTFGEYRYDHLHAGIDISTHGGTGYRVRAADAGVVFRLKVEWRGYGRALYLRHPNGRVSVYGHLERYEDAVLKLERRVARRQAEAHTRYPGDIYLDPPVRVRRGQIIAYSGESGVGLPHLHFEVRDRGDAPMDPFDAGLPWPKDSRPPVLESLTITSVAPSTFIDGEKREEVYPLRAGGDGARTTGHPVRVSGPFVAAVRAYDPAGSSGRSGVRCVDMAIDGGARYRLEFHSFGFGQFPQAGLIYDHRTSRLGPAAFTYRLVRLPGNELSPATAPPESRPAAGYPGALDLEPGPHMMDVSVVDSAGNRSRARICIQVGHPAAAESLAWDEEDPGHASVIVRFPAGEPARPATTPTRAGAPGCPPSPARTVEGEFWDDEQNDFRTMTCSQGEARCRRDAAPGARSRAVRVRETRDGVPGPWRILAGPPARPLSPPDEPPRLDAWPSFLDILAQADILANPSLRLVAGTATTPVLPLTYRSDRLWGAAVSYEEIAGRSPLTVAGGDPGPTIPLVLDVRWAGVDRPLQYEGPGFALTLPAGARFFTGPLVVRTESIAGPGLLPAVSEAVDLLPDGEALKDPATLAFDLIPGAVPPESLGIYRYDSGRERWGFEGGDIDAGGARIALRFRRYGRFALLQDASPPEILEVRPAPGSRGLPRRVAVQARVEDEGKGLNFDGVTFAIDGLPQDAEFDPDRGLAKGLDPRSLRPGRHHIRVEATDRAGNRSAVVEGDFEVR